MQSSYKPATRDELRIGLNFAMDKYGVRLQEDMLSTLFNKTLERRATGCSFGQALFWALSNHPVPSQRYTAYKGAVGKMGSYRRTFSLRQARKPRKLPQLERVRKYVALNEKSNQYEMIM